MLTLMVRAIFFHKNKTDSPQNLFFNITIETHTQLLN